MSEVTLERLKQLPYRRHYPMTLTKELRSKGVWQWMVEGFVTIWDMECGGMSTGTSSASEAPNQLPSERPWVKIDQNHFSPPTAPNPYNLAFHFFEHPQKYVIWIDLVPILVQAFSHSHSWELSWAAERSGRTGKW